MKYTLFILLFILLSPFSMAYQWHNPFSDGKSFVSGRWWNDQLSDSYFRIPERFASELPSAVRNLAKHSAGEYIKFTTNSKDIIVRYILTSKNELQMWHMPSTGVSGVDLYLTNSNGEDHWCASSSRNFSDTVTYVYKCLEYSDIAEFRLYLPLYNGIEFMEIGVCEDANFSFETEDGIKPIVIYGTSIAQGACASRPGMAWTNILNRRLKIPVVNLGFSGSAHMESVMFGLLSEIPARVYVIDCMPNMINALSDSIVPRLTRGVEILRNVNDAPILLVEHDGYMNENTVRSQKEDIEYINSQLKKVYCYLLSKGEKNIYYLSKSSIAMDEDSQVDACHATDYGMLLYADAYQKILSRILRRSK